MYNISIFRFSCLFTNMQITLSVTVPWNWLLKVLRQQDLFHILHRVCLLPLLSRFKIERAGCIDSFVVYLLFYFSHCSTGCKHGVQGPLWHAIHLAPSNILIPAYILDEPTLLFWNLQMFLSSGSEALSSLLIEESNSFLTQTHR